MDNLTPKQSYISNINYISNIILSIESNLIYAAQCTKCCLLYLGQFKDQLNVRSNSHISDIKSNPFS